MANRRGNPRYRDVNALNEELVNPNAMAAMMANIQRRMEEQDEVIRNLRQQLRQRNDARVKGDRSSEGSETENDYSGSGNDHSIHYSDREDNRWEIHGIRQEPLYERFGRMKPASFEGLTDPLEAEKWLSSIETILDFMELDDRERVLCASYMLKKDARYWWGAVKLRRDVGIMTWNDFVREFNHKYYNSTALRAQ
ncbi:hypothetical protein UlMin_017196 [Ulmus minor]